MKALKLKLATGKTPAFDWLRFSLLAGILAAFIFACDLTWKFVYGGEVSLSLPALVVVALSVFSQMIHFGFFDNKVVWAGAIKNNVAPFLYMPWETEIAFADRNEFLEFVKFMDKRGSFRLYHQFDPYVTTVIRFTRKSDASQARLRFHYAQNS